MLIAHLRRALPIDLENDIDAQSQLLVDPCFRCAIKIAIDLGAFEKLFGLAHRAEGFFIDEVIVNPVDLTGARRTRRMRYRHTERFGASDKRLHKTGLTGT